MVKACTGPDACQDAVNSMGSLLMQLCQRPILHEGPVLQLLRCRGELLCQQSIQPCDDHAAIASCTCTLGHRPHEIQLWTVASADQIPAEHRSRLLALEVEALQQLGAAGLLCYACWSVPCLQVRQTGNSVLAAIDRSSLIDAIVESQTPADLHQTAGRSPRPTVSALRPRLPAGH